MNTKMKRSLMTLTIAFVFLTGVAWADVELEEVQDLNLQPVRDSATVERHLFSDLRGQVEIVESGQFDDLTAFAGSKRILLAEQFEMKYLPPSAWIIDLDVRGTFVNMGDEPIAVMLLIGEPMRPTASPRPNEEIWDQLVMAGTILPGETVAMEYLLVGGWDDTLESVILDGSRNVSARLIMLSNAPIKAACDGIAIRTKLSWM
jgi:hypothetical protein